MRKDIQCEIFREKVESTLSEAGAVFQLPEKEKEVLHNHGQKCEKCREWGKEFAKIPLSREQEDFLDSIYRRERKLAPRLYWTLFVLGIIGGILLLAGIFFYLEERMAPELTPGVKMEGFAPGDRPGKREKKKLSVEKNITLRDFLKEDAGYSSISFPLSLLRGEKPESFFRRHLGKCRIYKMEKDASGRELIVHLHRSEWNRFAELRKKLRQKKR